MANLRLSPDDEICRTKLTSEGVCRNQNREKLSVTIAGKMTGSFGCLKATVSTFFVVASERKEEMKRESWGRCGCEDMMENLANRITCCESSGS
jgi:hypothetical protein